jgi:hypothetical protein
MGRLHQGRQRWGVRLISAVRRVRTRVRVLWSRVRAPCTRAQSDISRRQEITITRR